MPQSQESKYVVLDRISAGERWVSEGRATFRIGINVLHVRFKSNAPYSFNINPNTLTADFEVWICGNADTYYLIPTQIMRRIYDHPGTYTDYRHPEIRVVSVNVLNNTVTYATGGEKMDIATYLGGTL